MGATLIFATFTGAFSTVGFELEWVEKTVERIKYWGISSSG